MPFFHDALMRAYNTASPWLVAIIWMAYSSRSILMVGFYLYTYICFYKAGRRVPSLLDMVEFRARILADARRRGLYILPVYWFDLLYFKRFRAFDVAPGYHHQAFQVVIYYWYRVVLKLKLSF